MGLLNWFQKRGIGGKPDFDLVSDTFWNEQFSACSLTISMARPPRIEVGGVLPYTTWYLMHRKGEEYLLGVYNAYRKELALGLSPYYSAHMPAAHDLPPAALRVLELAWLDVAKHYILEPEPPRVP